MPLPALEVALVGLPKRIWSLSFGWGGLTGVLLSSPFLPQAKKIMLVNRNKGNNLLIIIAKLIRPGVWMIAIAKLAPPDV